MDFQAQQEALPGDQAAGRLRFALLFIFLPGLCTSSHALAVLAPSNVPCPNTVSWVIAPMHGPLSLERVKCAAARGGERTGSSDELVNDDLAPAGGIPRADAPRQKRFRQEALELCFEMWQVRAGLPLAFSLLALGEALGIVVTEPGPLDVPVHLRSMDRGSPSAP